MTEWKLSLGLAFLWLGFSLVFFLLFCITHIDRDNSSIDSVSRANFRLGRVGRLILAALGVSGAWGLATLLGLYRSSDGYVQVFMLAGMLVGVAVSYRMFGWPNIDFKKKPKD